MPATREKVFQSMQESLEKIDKNTAVMGAFAKTAEDLLEAGRAQKIRDQEQHKQTSALEKISKTSIEAKKEQSFFGKHWGKMLLGLLIIAGLIYKGLPKFPKMPKAKDIDPALDKDEWKKAFRNMKDFNKWKEQWNKSISKIDPKTGKLIDPTRGGFEETEITKALGIGTGSLGETFDALQHQIPKAGAGGAQNIKIQAGRAGGLIKGLVQGPYDTFKRGAKQIGKMAGLDKSHNEMKKQNREAERLRNQKADIEKAEKKAYKEKEQREKKERKATRQRMADLEKENKQKREAAAAKAKTDANAKKVTKQQAYDADQKRLKNIAQTKIDVKNARVHAEELGLKKKATKLPTIDPLKQAKQNVKTGIKYGSKAWRIWRVTSIAMTSMGPYAATAALLGMTALEVWAETDHGKETLAEHKITLDEVGKEIYGKLFTPFKKAKNLAGTGGFDPNAIAEGGGKYIPLASTDAATMRQVEKLKKKEPTLWERAKKLFKFGGREGQGATRIEKNVDTLVKLNPEMARMMHISGSAFQARGETQRVTSGFRNREAQIKAMNWQRDNQPQQYKTNYGNVTPEEWLKTKSSKHQHGNGIDIGYPDSYKDDEILKEALVSDINMRLVRAGMGFSAHARKEGNHIHLALRGSKTKEEVKAFDATFMEAYNANKSGTTLNGLNQFKIDPTNANSQGQVNIVDNSNNSANTTALMTGNATDKGGFWHKQNNDIGFGLGGL